MEMRIVGVLLVRDNVAMMGVRAPSFVHQKVDDVADLGYVMPHLTHPLNLISVFLTF